jgi:tetraacyldisaccharide 4'-kinase
MSSREFCSRRYLIPASFYREPLSSLRRADILIINYKEQIANIEKVKGQIKNKFKHLEIYTAAYGLVGLYGLNNERIDISELNGKKLAGLCAIGYPEGFFNLLKTLKLNIVKQLVYPDHYEFGRQEFEAIQDSLLVQGINTVVITHKDKFHLPDKGAKINFYIAQIKLAIDEEDKFFSDIEERLRRF